MKAIALLTSFVYLVSVMADGDNDLYELSIEELLNIPVSVASNVNQKRELQPASVTTLSQADIQLSGARTLSELLALTIPGYFMVEDQDDTIAGFRGLVPDNNSKVMLLLNGINLNTEYFWGPPDAILNGIDFDYIKRIEVIRGPGSVTLGQGALLGVINIVTAEPEDNTAKISLKYGRDQLMHRSMSFSSKLEHGSWYFYASDASFEGEELGSQGFSGIRLEQGLKVFERQHHLRRSDLDNYLSRLNYKDFEFSLFKFRQKRDLFSFVRDREAVEQTLKGAYLKYNKSLNSKHQIQVNYKYLQDDYALFSHGGNIETDLRLDYELNGSPFAPIAQTLTGLADKKVRGGLIMGGTRERRNGIDLVLNISSDSGKFNSAIGMSYNHIESGLPNDSGHNFIINEEIQRLGIDVDNSGNLFINGDLNETNTWVNNRAINIKSAFSEHFYTASNDITLFAAARYDDHPDWGDQLSPRIGALVSLNTYHQLRLSWQRGFRGAVAVQFTGGFVQDGFLQQENFDFINQISGTYVDADFDGDVNDDTVNLRPVTPEILDSLELAYSYRDDRIFFQSVLFHNIVRDILIADAHGYVGLSFGDQVGSDEVGTWGGNWYYQNLDGSLKQAGLETELKYQAAPLYLSFSHAFVKAIEVDDSATGAYVLPNKELIAYPNHVLRIQLGYSQDSSLGLFNFSLNTLNYSSHTSSNGNKLPGNSFLNAGLSFVPSSNNKLKIGLVLKNILDNNDLAPTVGTGDIGNEDGGPTNEGRTWWLSAGYIFD